MGAIDAADAAGLEKRRASLMSLAAPLVERVHTLLATNPTAAAGKLQMIGIADIRERLGDRWGKSRGHIKATIEHIIKNEIGHGDVMFEADDLAYVVLFGGRGIDESRLICAKIAQDICRKLFGESENVAQVRSLTCLANGELLAQNVDISATLDALLESAGDEQVFGRDGAIDKTPPVETIEQEQPVQLFDPWGIPVAARLSALQFWYSPIWDVERHVVVSYLCRAHVAEPQPNPQYGERFLLAEEIERQVDIDLLALKDCVTKIEDLKAHNRRVLLACPIHWSTIARGRSWERFKDPLHALSKASAQDLLICVHGLDAGLPNIRLSQEFPKIAGHVRAVHACLTYGDKSIERFANTQTTAVGFAMPEDASDERAIMVVAREFCVVADGRKLPAFVLGVSTRSAAMALVGAGFRYLEGPAIRPPTTAPRDAFAQETIDLFRQDILEMSTGN